MFAFLRILSILLCTVMFTAARAELPPVSGEVAHTLAPMLARTLPSVVNIVAQGDIPLYHMLEERGAENGAAPHGSGKFESAGSGVILDGKHGYIITNAHVVKDANLITVTLNDHRRVKAKLLGSDDASDIAVLEVKAPNLQAMPIGDSDHLQVGDFVVVIGSPFGVLRQSVSSGIISGLSRSNLGIEGYEDFIQTDAPINRGNSGGGLIDMKGRLIGINTAIMTAQKGGGSVGIGFAIPVNMATKVAKQLIQYGKVNRGLMGVYVQNLTPELKSAMGFDDKVEGALVTQVNANSPAAKAGLKAGDVITAVDGKAITAASQVRNTVGLTRVGTKLKMQVLRDGKSRTLSAATAEAKDVHAAYEADNPFLAGLTLRNIEQQSPAHGYVRGVLVPTVGRDSSAWQAGLRPGDIIVAANQQPTNDIASLRKLAKDAKGTLVVNVNRGGGAMFFVVRS